MLEDYPIVIWYSREDECYVASIPDFEGCMAHGDTAEDAAKEIQIAGKMWMESVKRHAGSLPLPTRASA